MHQALKEVLSIAGTNKDQWTNRTIQIDHNSQSLYNAFERPNQQSRNTSTNATSSTSLIIPNELATQRTKMSLRIRCPNCRRGMSGKHSLCKDCRGSSSSPSQTTVYVVESGARIEVTTDRPSRSSSSRRGEHSSYSRDAAYYCNGYAGGSGTYSAEDSYRDTRQGHESLRPGYVRPRVHPYSDRYEYISADAQPGFPPRGGMYPSSAQRVNTSSSYTGYSQPTGSSDRYQPQPSYAQTQQARGQGSHVQYVYSGTEGPDGEIID